LPLVLTVGSVDRFLDTSLPLIRGGHLDVNRCLGHGVFAESVIDLSLNRDDVWQLLGQRDLKALKLGSRRGHLESLERTRLGHSVDLIAQWGVLGRVAAEVDGEVGIEHLSAAWTDVQSAWDGRNSGAELNLFSLRDLLSAHDVCYCHREGVRSRLLKSSLEQDDRRAI